MKANTTNRADLIKKLPSIKRKLKKLGVLSSPSSKGAYDSCEDVLPSIKNHTLYELK